ncbi:MAG TPA: hypothetical protein DEB39_00125 [Planctomycetaceae bacterium]|nr:hypothetical protein [Planctomycetaceae bacterium]
MEEGIVNPFKSDSRRENYRREIQTPSNLAKRTVPVNQGEMPIKRESTPLTSLMVTGLETVAGVRRAPDQ